MIGVLFFMPLLLLVAVLVRIKGMTMRRELAFVFVYLIVWTSVFRLMLMYAGDVLLKGITLSGSLTPTGNLLLSLAVGAAYITAAELYFTKHPTPWR